MNALVERWATPLLTFLAEWSLRWGIVIGVLAVWLAVRPPRSAAMRHLLCLVGLAAGCLLPVGPRWGHAVVPWSFRSLQSADRLTASASPQARIRRAEQRPGSPPAADEPNLRNHARGAASLEQPAREAAGSRSVRAEHTPMRAWRVASLVAAGAWMVVVLTLIVRLIGGWKTLMRLRREATELMGRESERLLEECRAALGLNRPVQLLSHASVVSPAVLAGACPIVLVPTGWIDWPESHRRASLLHELAHLARYDDWTKLAQEILRIPFFFHPLVRWLLARLDLERELLGDEAVVALGFDPLSYARLLLELATRPGRLAAVLPPFRRGVLPFIDGRTVDIRIKRLLEEHMPSYHSGPSAGWFFLLGGALLAGALFVGGFRIRDRASSPQFPAIPGTDTLALHGRLVDAAGSPVVGAKLLGLYESRFLQQFVGATAATDAAGEFRAEFVLPPAPNRSIAVGDRLRMIVRLRDGSQHEVSFLRTEDGGVSLALAVQVAPPPGVNGPRDCAPGELTGRVVGALGKPIKGALADVWSFFPGNEAETDADGFFRITGLAERDPDPNVEVVIRKAGYSPQLFLSRPTGRPGWVIVLRDKTYFEGRVIGPDGKPVKGARIRANCGPKLTAGEVWTEATTGDDGRYRMYAQADVYDIQVRVPGVGVARLPETVLGPDQARPLDIRLEPGLSFRAKLVDSVSGKPVPGVVLRRSTTNRASRAAQDRMGSWRSPE